MNKVSLHIQVLALQSLPPQGRNCFTYTSLGPEVVLFALKPSGFRSVCDSTPRSGPTCLATGKCGQGSAATACFSRGLPPTTVLGGVGPSHPWSYRQAVLQSVDPNHVTACHVKTWGDSP